MIMSDDVIESCTNLARLLKELEVLDYKLIASANKLKTMLKGGGK